ncbi:MAG: DNA polymerase-3 subunit delta' [Acidimicrobiales bacterium]
MSAFRGAGSAMTDMAGPGVDLPDPWSAVVGQDVAVSRLTAAADDPVHAYLFLGQPGSGGYAAALGFAALILSDGLDGDGAARARRLALNAVHPDVVVVEPEGAALRVEEAREILRAGQISPVEGARKVIVVHAVDVIQEAAIGMLLKLIEEPPSSTIFVLLAEDIPPEIITIASRCVTVEFGPIPLPIIEATLVGEGVSPRRVKIAAAASGGDLGRARLLSTDDALATRAELWKSIPDRLDGKGVTVWELVNQVREGMDGAQEPLVARQAQELEELEARVEATGERGAGRSQLVARHKREVRRLRIDEIRFGLATIARVYRDRLVAGPDPQAASALHAVQHAAQALVRNPNEPLLLQSLFLNLAPGVMSNR